MTLEIFVGDVSEELAHTAQQYDPDAYLVTSDNVYDKHQGTVYTSIGDLDNLKQFIDILSTATRIVYSPPTTWPKTSNDAILYSIAHTTLHYLYLVTSLRNIPIDNLPPLSILLDTTPTSRKTSKTQLWTVGCSTTVGIGVDITERYSNLVAKDIDINLSVLAHPGSSIVWAADQILRSDIIADDIVVWGLTDVNRFPWIIDNKLQHITIDYYKKNPEFNKLISIDTFNSKHRLYEALTAIKQVQNFCNKVNVKLLLVGIHANIELSRHLVAENFISINLLELGDKFLDLGTDKLHPGPQTHKFYSEKILNKLQQLGWYNA